MLNKILITEYESRVASVLDRALVFCFVPSPLCNDECKVKWNETEKLLCFIYSAFKRVAEHFLAVHGKWNGQNILIERQSFVIIIIRINTLYEYDCTVNHKERLPSNQPTMQLPTLRDILNVIFHFSLWKFHYLWFHSFTGGAKTHTVCVEESIPIY